MPAVSISTSTPPSTARSVAVPLRWTLGVSNKATAIGPVVEDGDREAETLVAFVLGRLPAQPEEAALIKGVRAQMLTACCMLFSLHK
jgi:hypothetical protein